MRVIRAYDGRSIIVNQPLSQFSSLDDLLDCFSLATEIPSDAIICMTSNGSQLRQDLLENIIQHEASSASTAPTTTDNRDSDPPQWQEFFVFNRDFLFTNPTDLAHELAEDPVLEPAPHHSDFELNYPPTPKSLEALVAWSTELTQHTTTHERRCRDLLDSIAFIARSTHVALSNLKIHTENIDKGAKELIDDVAAKELSRMQRLLDGYERDLYILGMITIHPRLQSNSSSNSTNNHASTSNSKPKHRTLGDYISKTKMSAVAEACARVYSELKDRIHQIQNDLAVIRQDTQGLSIEVEATTPEVSDETYQRVVEAEARARSLQQFISATCSPDHQGWPVADKLDEDTFNQVVEASDELVLLDEVVRESVRRLNQDRNDILERSLHLLADISSLQSEFGGVGSLLAALDADLHSNKVDGFKHLNRLKNMLWAYGATVVEVVRRREFAKHFLGKSQSLAELMAKMSASEVKRRQLYRTDISSLLPWEVKGMEDKPPSLEITTPRVSSEGMADLSIADLETLYQLLDHVHQKLQEDSSLSNDPSPIPQVKAALQRLAAALQDLDDEFIYLVNQQLLGAEEELATEDEDESGSETSIRARRRKRHPRRITSAANGPSSEAFEQLKRDLTSAQEAHAKEQMSLKEEHAKEASLLRSEIEALRKQLDSEKASVANWQEKAESARDQVNSLTADLETERERRLNMVDEVSQLRKDLEQTHRQEAEARQEALEEGDRVSELEAHMHEMQIELEEAKVARNDARNRIEALLSEGSSVERELRTAQARIDELTEQVSTAHTEAAKARESMAEMEAVKERQIRSYRAEADGDRAILEEKVRALQAEIEVKQKQIEEQKSVAAQAQQSRRPDREEIELLRGQLRAADDAHEEIVKEMERAKEMAEEADASRKDVEESRQQLLEHSKTLLGKSFLLRKTVRSMPSHSSRQASSSSTGAVPTTATSGVAETAQRAIGASTGGLSASELSESERQAALDAFETHADAADLEVTLGALRAFDANEMFDEVKSKLDSLNVHVRKWYKAYKSAHDKAAKANAAARDKIAFRNFQSGDLALFLPTRNTNLTAKPWAAFNISFPHFFLHATGPLSEQLKTKEWIVARITGITEHVASNASISEETAVDDGKKNEKEGNPFQLAEGVRYFLLDVETWSGSSAAAPSLRSRKSSSAIVSATDPANGHKASERKKLERSRSENVSSLSKAKEEEETHEAEPEQATSAFVHGQQQQKPQQEDAEAQVSGFSLRSQRREASEQLTPPMQTPETSPRAKSDQPLASIASAEPIDGVRPGTLPATHHPSVVDSEVPTETRSSAPPSGLTRALRAASPVSSRQNNETVFTNGRPRTGTGVSITGWSAKSDKSAGEEDASRLGPNSALSTGLGGGLGIGDGESSSAGGSSSRRSTIIEHATMAPAFGRGGGGKNRRLGDLRGRNLSPSDRETAGGLSNRFAVSGQGLAADRAGRGILSTPASQSRSDGIAIRTAQPLESALGEVAMTNPFSQSPGPASLPADRDGLTGFGGRQQARRKSSLNISTSASVMAGEGGSQHDQIIPEESPERSTSRDRDQPEGSTRSSPKIERWPTSGTASATTEKGEGVSIGGGRTVSSSNVARTASIRINGQSLVFDSSANSHLHRRQGSAATTAVTVAHAIPGAFPSSASSSNSVLAMAASPSSDLMGGKGSGFAAASSLSPASPSLTSMSGTFHHSSPSFTSANKQSSPARPAASSGDRKPSFLSQTLGRFTGAAAAAINTPPFAPAAAGSSSTALGPCSSTSPSTSEAISGTRTIGRSSHRRPSLFQSFPATSSEGDVAHRGTPDSTLSGLSGVSQSSAEGILKRIQGQNTSSSSRNVSHSSSK